MTQQVEKHIGIPVEQHAVTFRGEDARNAQSGCLCWLQNYRNRLTILFVSLLVITLTGLGHQVPSVPYFFRTANAKGSLPAPCALQCVDVGAYNESLIPSECQDINEAWDGQWGEEPTLYNNSTKSWRSLHEWQQHFFISKFSRHRLPLSTFRRDKWLRFIDRNMQASSKPVLVSLEEYLMLAAKHPGNVFLFSRVEESEMQESAQRGLQMSSSAKARASFFRDLASGYVRPNISDSLIKVFAFDGRSTGHGMHCHGKAWIAQIFGRKLWFLAPPSDEITLINSAGRPSFPYANLTELEGGCPCTWLLQSHLVPRHGVRACVQKPGQLLTIPKRWWHSTCSLDEYNIAIGGQLN